MIHVLDHLVAETDRFGDDPHPQAGPIGPAHAALVAAGVKIGGIPMLELCARHAQFHRDRGIAQSRMLNAPDWNATLGAEGVRHIQRLVNAAGTGEP